MCYLVAVRSIPVLCFDCRPNETKNLPSVTCTHSTRALFACIVVFVLCFRHNQIPIDVRKLKCRCNRLVSSLSLVHKMLDLTMENEMQEEIFSRVFSRLAAANFFLDLHTIDTEQQLSLQFAAVCVRASE